MDDERPTPNALSDEALMARYANGDPAAFDQLFQRFEPRAFAFFLRRTDSRQAAEDLYQELFLRIHRSRDRYDASRPFTPWFFQIANRLLIDHHRRAFRAHEVPIEDRDPAGLSPACDARLEDREDLSAMLEALSPEERYVVLAVKLEGLSYRELSEHLDKSVDAVKKLASRAILRARSEITAASMAVATS